jgi:hypothetical protein
VTERLPITNLLLLLTLTGFLLISGSLQCAFDCLTQAGNGRSVAARVNDCHLAIHQPDPVSPSTNKACHQGTQQQQDLGGPQLFSLNQLQHPLSSGSRQQMPVFRAGASLPLLSARQPRLLAGQNNDSFGPSQQLRSLRATVLQI